MERNSFAGSRQFQDLKTTMPAGGGGSGRHRYVYPALGGEIAWIRSLGEWEENTKDDSKQY